MYNILHYITFYEKKYLYIILNTEYKAFYTFIKYAIPNYLGISNCFCGNKKIS